MKSFLVPREPTLDLHELIEIFQSALSLAYENNCDIRVSIDATQTGWRSTFSSLISIHIGMVERECSFA